MRVSTFGARAQAAEASAKTTRPVANPFLLPGIALRTGQGDRYPIDQMLLQRWHKGAWRSFGGLWAYRGG